MTEKREQSDITGTEEAMYCHYDHPKPEPGTVCNDRNNDSNNSYEINGYKREKCQNIKFRT